MEMRRLTRKPKTGPPEQGDRRYQAVRHEGATFWNVRWAVYNEGRGWSDVIVEGQRFSSEIQAQAWINKRMWANEDEGEIGPWQR